MGTVNQEDQLTRIADALEGIHEELINISLNINCIDNRLSDCISHVGNNNFLCITGNVSTD